MRDEWKKQKVLITVKTYPIPSSKHDELVCTAGVTEEGDFIRLYPVNFRDLPYDQQYQTYQWIEVDVVKHRGQDVRKESFRPRSDSIKLIGEWIPPNPGNWSERAKFVLKNEAQSIEDLQDQRAKDKTSLGIFRPKSISDLKIVKDKGDWDPKFYEALKQQRLEILEYRKKTLVPPRKVPFKFQYVFECDDSRCNGHTIMIEDWEVGALFWRNVNSGLSHNEAAEMVKKRFFDEICGDDKETFFYVGTHSQYPGTWLVVGLFYPKKVTQKSGETLSLFDNT